MLGYSRWEKFQHAIEQGKKACEQSNQQIADHFRPNVKMVQIGSKAQRKIEDYHLSRYGCYLVLQNADPTGKPVVALAQTYFAVQTRRLELSDDEILATLSEDQRRLLVRGQLSLSNRQLATTASRAGVISPGDFAIFQNHGYKGLYGGLTENQIHARKNLKPLQKFLDHMGSTELAANLFRATQTDEQITREGITNKGQANQAHFTMGKRVRQFIKDGGGTMPEDLPTPEKSIQQLQREEKTRIERDKQPRLFPLEE